MNFQPFTRRHAPYTAAEQAAAWDAYISQDEYLSAHRGEYARARRGLPADCPSPRLEPAPRTSSHIKGTAHTFQLRVDMLNFGNLLNDEWGVGRRMISESASDHPLGGPGRSR